MTEPQIILTGLAFPESPRWHDGRLWVADWGASELITVDPGGMRSLVTRVESFPFCIDWLPDGRLLVVSAADRALLRMEPDGRLVEHADLSVLSDHPWNDIVVDGRGNAYMGNIGFDFPEGEPAPGNVALVTPDGSVSQVADGVMFPNGMAVTADGSTLIVAESYGNCLTAFDISEDGSLSGRRVWAPLGDGAPDGICIDAEGAVWYGDVPNKRCVRVRAGGGVLATVELDRGCFACALGGKDGRTLFMVANEWGGDPSAGPAGQVLSIAAPAAGAAWR